MYFNFPSPYIGNNRNYLPKIFSAYSKKKNYLRGIFFYLRGKTTDFLAKKRGESPVFMGSLLFAKTKILHFPAKSKLL